MLADGRIGWGPFAFELESGLPEQPPDFVAIAARDLPAVHGRYELVTATVAADGHQTALAVRYRPPPGVPHRGSEDVPQSRLVLLEDGMNPRALLREGVDLPAHTAIGFSRDLLAAGGSARVEVWSRAKAAPVTVLEIGKSHAVRDLRFSADGSHVAAVTAAGELGIWSCAEWDRTASVAAHDGPADAVAWSADGSMVATAGVGGAAFWDLSGERLGGYEAERIEGVAFGSKGELFVSRRRDAYVVDRLRLDEGAEDR